MGPAANVAARCATCPQLASAEAHGTRDKKLGRGNAGTPKFGQVLQLRFPSKDKLAIKVTTETDDGDLFLAHSLQKNIRQMSHRAQDKVFLTAISLASVTNPQQLYINLYFFFPGIYSSKIQ